MQVRASKNAAAAVRSSRFPSANRPSRVVRATASLVAAVLLFGGCTMTGRDAATNRVYTPAEGTNDRDAAVDVLGAVIVSGQRGSGTFIASFVNNNNADPASVDSLSGGAANPDLTVKAFDGVDLPARGLVDLSDDGGVPVSGDFGAGDFVEVRIGLGDGTEVTMNVPVVNEAGPWEGLDQSA